MPVVALFRHPSIREQATELQARGDLPVAGVEGRVPASWTKTLPNLVTCQPRGASPPLFVVHGWGGTLDVFIHLARALAPHRPMMGLQASNAGEAEPELPAVRAMAADYAEQILQRQPRGPIHLLGYSGGGWYAHAVALELQARGANLGLFGVLDSGVAARIHRRLGATLLWRHALPRLKAAGARRRQSPDPTDQRWPLRRQLGQLHSLLYWYLNLRVSRPGQKSRDDPFLEHLKRDYRPERSRLAVDLFAPEYNLPELQQLWSFYALGGVRCHPLNAAGHLDFYRPELAPTLAALLEDALGRIERAQAHGNGSTPAA
jgi:thioesterase domain-containing protein